MKGGEMFFKKKCKHNYKALATHNETIKERVWTHILFQCICGEWFVDTIPGSWTKEEIKSIK